MAAFKYSPQRPYYPARRGQQARGGGDFERGWQIGGQIGKGLSGLASAIKTAREQAAQDVVANQLMDEQAASQLPPAQSLGRLDGGGGEQTQALGTLDQSGGAPPGSYLNPATGSVEPLQGTDANAPLTLPPVVGGSGATVGSIGNAPAQGGDLTLPDTSGAGPKVGGLVHTGGLAEMRLRQEFQKNQLNYEAGKTRLANLLNPPAKPGRIGVQPQPGQAGAWTGYQPPKAGASTTRVTKGQPEEPIQIGSEPVTDQTQLVQFFDGIYGKGAFGKVMANITNATVSDDGKSVAVGPPGKPINVSLSDAQVYTKQLNVLRHRQGLAPLPVLGEDPNLGADQTNPYPATNNLDVYSRAPGTWVRLPNGNIAQVPKP
jgi:hypothetical protein